MQCYEDKPSNTTESNYKSTLHRPLKV